MLEYAQLWLVMLYVVLSLKSSAGVCTIQATCFKGQNWSSEEKKIVIIFQIASLAEYGMSNINYKVWIRSKSLYVFYDPSHELPANSNLEKGDKMRYFLASDEKSPLLSPITSWTTTSKPAKQIEASSISWLLRRTWFSNSVANVSQG